MEQATFDVTGLPREVVRDLEKLVQTLRHQFAATGAAPTPMREETAGLSADEWIARFRAWSESHPRRESIIDDSRESIYTGRGE